MDKSVVTGSFSFSIWTYLYHKMSTCRIKCQQYFFILTFTEAPFLDLHLSIANRFVFSKIYDKRDDFDFDIVNFPFLDGDVPRRASYGVYISQLISLLESAIML